MLKPIQAMCVHVCACLRTSPVLFLQRCLHPLMKPSRGGRSQSSPPPPRTGSSSPGKQPNIQIVEEF